jgi:hypothetical protein
MKYVHVTCTVVLQYMLAGIILKKFYYCTKTPKIVACHTAKEFKERCVQLSSPWPDFEGRCGDVRTTPEIILHLPWDLGKFQW